MICHLIMNITVFRNSTFFHTKIWRNPSPGPEIVYFSGAGLRAKKIKEPKKQEVKRGEMGEKQKKEGRRKRGGKTTGFTAPTIY